MSGHTPTTEEVREAYADWNSTDVFGAPGIPTGESRENFDRWLAGIRAEVVEQIAQAIERRKRDMAEGYAGDARAMLEIGMDTAARIARQATP